MSRSTVSRRVSEVVGVALFACALIWLIALVSYTPSDPVWFFNTGSAAVPANFAGRVGAFLAELSFQLLGYASYLVPTVLIVVGWHYFWCHALEAAYTKAVGGAAALRLPVVVPEPGLREPGGVGQDVPRGRLPGRMAGLGARRVPEPHRLASSSS